MGQEHELHAIAKAVSAIVNRIEPWALPCPLTTSGDGQVRRDLTGRDAAHGDAEHLREAIIGDELQDGASRAVGQRGHGTQKLPTFIATM